VHPLKIRAAQKTGRDAVGDDHEKKNEGTEHAGNVAAFAQTINAEMRAAESTAVIDDDSDGPGTSGGRSVGEPFGNANVAGKLCFAVKAGM